MDDQRRIITTDRAGSIWAGITWCSLLLFIVAGIIGSRGSYTWENHLGVARSAGTSPDIFWNLKSAFRRSSGAVGLVFSDAIDNIDWGICKGSLIDFLVLLSTYLPRPILMHYTTHQILPKLFMTGARTRNDNENELINATVTTFFTKCSGDSCMLAWTSLSLRPGILLASFL